MEVTSAIQCGGKYCFHEIIKNFFFLIIFYVGNRRFEMHQIKPIKGLPWKGGAIGNAKWGGVR